MRARGIAGRQERRELGREDDDPLVAIDYGYLKLDGTEDDDDDEDGETHVMVGVFVLSTWVSQESHRS